ncbi:hypothetical protein [Roseiconus nitratireducens]|uniref:hypothetical protein n=1 Tax=Roseiconus nitratireducens TaxID=2605748 RepID=UPI001376260F|nr:hypothetical protein [Roseiconus nitratireducens]
MSLQRAFESVLETPHAISRLDAVLWQQLTLAVTDPEHPWSVGTLITTDAGSPTGQPVPDGRMVVLRNVVTARRTLECHTDVRSGKVHQIQDCRHSPTPSDLPSRIAWLFYDPAAKIQLRLQGRAQVINDASADVAWKDTPLASRSSYLSIATPGTEVPSVLPPSTDDRIVSDEASERGRASFRIVRTVIDRSDWLYLRPQGHLRMATVYAGKSPLSRWLVP